MRLRFLILTILTGLDPSIVSAEPGYEAKFLQANWSSMNAIAVGLFLHTLVLASANKVNQVGGVFDSSMLEEDEIPVDPSAESRML